MGVDLCNSRLLLRKAPKPAEAIAVNEKRAITRQILKNEGLKKYRKKEDRKKE